jgi:hypothetical protein
LQVIDSPQYSDEPAFPSTGAGLALELEPRMHIRGCDHSTHAFVLARTPCLIGADKIIRFDN